MPSSLKKIFIACVVLPTLVGLSSQADAHLPFKIGKSSKETADTVFRIRDSANNAACGENSPVAEESSYFGLDNRTVKLHLHKIIQFLAGQETEVIMMGDTHHNFPDIRGFLSNSDNIAALAEAGFDIAVEYPQKFQTVATDFAEGKISREAFIQDLNEKMPNLRGNKENRALSDLADMIERATRMGIRVHFADPGNHEEAYERANEAMSTAMKQLFADFEGPESTETPLQTQNRIKYEDAFRLYQEAFRARHEDRDLAEFINQITDGGRKVLLIYGAAHGSRAGDFEKHLQSRKVTKVDLFLNQKSYDETQRNISADRRVHDIPLFEEKPELAYFINSGTAWMTCNTPPSLARALYDAAPVPVGPPTLKR